MTWPNDCAMSDWCISDDARAVRILFQGHSTGVHFDATAPTFAPALLSAHLQSIGALWLRRVAFEAIE